MTPYFSVDIETTAVDHNIGQVLEIAAVFDDGTGRPIDDLPRWETLVNPGVIVGEPFALSMHPKLLRRIANGQGVSPDEAVKQLALFMEGCGYLNRKATFAGKNFAAFDLAFLRKLPEWSKVKAHHRYIDVGNLFWNPQVDDSIPDSKTCMERAGIPGEVAHTAMEDALAVVKMIRFYADRFSKLGMAA